MRNANELYEPFQRMSHRRVRMRSGAETASDMASHIGEGCDNDGWYLNSGGGGKRTKRFQGGGRRLEGRHNSASLMTVVPKNYSCRKLPWWNTGEVDGGHRTVSVVHI